MKSATTGRTTAALPPMRSPPDARSSSAAAHPKQHGRGLHLTGWDRVVQLELRATDFGAGASGEVTDDADDLVPAAGLRILRRGASAGANIADAPAEGVAAENPLGQRPV